MNFQFTPTVRDTLEAALDEAIRLGHDYVAPRHVFSVFLAQGVLAPLLASLRLGTDDLRRALPQERRGKCMYHERANLPYTSSMKTTLQQALEEARASRLDRVSTRELLIGILEADGVLARALDDVGLTADLVRAMCAPGDDLPRDVDMDRSSGGGEAVWFLRVDPSAESPLYEQIVSGIEEAVATGRLAEGERLPSVRQLSAELEIAPGTVARAYSTLEEKGVVVTEGARGTRVAPREIRTEPPDERSATLEALFRPGVVAAFHIGAKADEVVQALERAMRGIYDGEGEKPAA